RFLGVPGRTYYFVSQGFTNTEILLYHDDGITLLGGDDDSGNGDNFQLAFEPSQYAYYRFSVVSSGNSFGSYSLNYYYYAAPDYWEPDNEQTLATSFSPVAYLS